MAKKGNQFIVPKDERNEFDLLVRRANYRIKKSMDYVQKEKGISDERTLHSIFGDYAYSSSPTAFSRSVKFSSEKAYKQYKQYISQWGQEVRKNVKDPIKYVSDKKIKDIRKGYIQNITKALNTLATELNIPLDDGKLPENLFGKISNLTTDQLVHFFDEDPEEMLSGQRWGSDEYEGADAGQFVDITVARLKTLRQLYPKKKKIK